MSETEKMNRPSASTQSIAEGGTASSRARLAALALLLLLIAFHVVNNWLWRSTNQVVFGFDRIFHKVTSLAYYDILRESVNLRTIFAALTWSDYYPPLVHLTAAVFYKLFGVTMDVAAMSTSLYLVVLLLAVYGLGERLAGPWVGLLSAFVVSMFPIIFSMSRYLYVDLALTAMVALNVCLLLRADRFRHKGYSLLYGLSLGLGLLTKWTFVAFTAAPLLAILTSPGLIGDALRALHPAAWNGRRLLISALLGLGLTALWFVPNVAATAALPLGYALVPLSWLIWTVTWAFVLAPAHRGTNLLAALGLGLSVASAWYLTKINFVGTFWLNAYGKSTGRSWGFAQYLDFLYREQLSPFFASVFLVAIAVLVWHRWRRIRSWRKVLALGAERWALVLWAVVSYVIFSSQVSIVHSRYIMPLLPPFGLAIALALSLARPRWVRALLTGLVVAVAMFQFAALSFDALAPLQERVPFLAEGLSIQLPASGRTDPGYWVVPDVMQTIENHRDTDSPRLGVLVNSNQVNSKQFIYLAYADYPQVQIQELATIGWAYPSYPRLFESDFILVPDPSPDYIRRPDTAATIERILTTPDDTFHRAFELVQTYPLPDGTRLLLYQRRFGPAPEAGADMASYEALMAGLAKAARPGDAVVVMPPELVYGLGRYGDGTLPIYPFSTADTAALARLGKEHERLWVALGDSRAYDPDARLARWLAEHFYRASDAWYGPLQIALYASAAGTGEGEGSPFQARQAAWNNGVRLQGYRFLDDEIPVGGIVRLDVRWQAGEPIPRPYKAFVHLLDGQGHLVSQRDSEPVDGTRPTTGWQPGETVDDKYGLLLPVGLPSGEYRIVLGLYDAETSERVAVCCPESDMLPVANVRIEGGVAHVSLVDELPK
jgi:4-amino-4-deoxy-L-arabinose transferase-like glycosyltransferase